MMKFIILNSSLCIIFLFQATKILAQDSLNFPTPTGNPNQLFFLQRTQNTNTVVYELNMKKGVIDSLEPVHVFWICYAEKSQREELTELQRKRAYGLATKYISKDHYELRFLANKKVIIQLMKGPDNNYHVYDQVNQKQAILTRVYLEIHGGSLFSPNIEYVLLNGIDPETGAIVSEKKKMKSD
jgi:Domain of unknown function (DUF4833)